MQSSRKTLTVCGSASRLPRLPRRYKSNQFCRVFALTATLGISGLLYGLPLHADTYNWIGAPINTLFENPLNWNKGIVPGLNDNAVNSTGNVIDYLIGAGSRTIQSFTNSGGGTLNLYLSDPSMSDPPVQSFVINGSVSNLLYTDPITMLQTPGRIDITGAVNASGSPTGFVTFNADFNGNSGTFTNAGSIIARDYGRLDSYSHSVVNLAYLDSVTHLPDNALGLSAFRNGQVLLLGDFRNGHDAFNNGDAAGLTPGWIHAYSDQEDVNTYIRIDPNINNYAGSHITAESISLSPGTPIGAGFQRIDLNNFPHLDNSYTNLTNSGVIEALAGAEIRTSAAAITNNAGGFITSDGLNAPALALGNRLTDPNATPYASAYASAVYLGNDFYAVNTINNAGTIQATNGGYLTVNATTITNNKGGIISAQGTDADSGFGSKLFLGNYSVRINQITNAGTIRAQDGGAVSLIFNTLNNSGSLLADGTGKVSTDVDPVSGDTVSQYAPASLGLFSSYNGIVSSDALINTGTIAATNGGQIGPLTFTSQVSFTNKGTISADGVGLITDTLLSNGDRVRDFLPSDATTRLYSYYSPTQYIPGTFTNDVSGVLSATNGANLSVTTVGSDIVNKGQVLVDGGNVFHEIEFFGGGGVGSVRYSNLSFDSFVQEDPFDTTGSPARGGAFLNTGTLTASNGGQLVIMAWNGLTNAGDIIVNGGNPGGTAKIDLSSSAYTSSNNVVTGGNIDFTGGSVLADSASFSAYAATTFTQAATSSITARDSSNIFLGSGGDFNNAGLIDASSGARLTLAVGGNLTNSGTIRAGSGATLEAGVVGSLANSGTIVFSGGASTLNGGETQIGASSRTQVDPGATLTVGGTGLILGTENGTPGSGGILTGGGTIIGFVHNFSGINSPGDPQQLTIMGNYDQGAFGALDILLEGDMPGTTYDVLNVSGNVALDGLLTLNFDTAFQPFAGETFDFLIYGGTLTGGFNQVQVLGLNNNFTYALNFSNGHSTLLITSAGAVPEPGTLALLLGLSVVGANFLRRKRKAG